MSELGWPEILTIAIIAFALFGWKRLPDASRSLGRSIRIFKSEISGMADDADRSRDTSKVQSGEPGAEQADRAPD